MSSSGRFVTVVLESVISGHKAYWVRAATAPRVERFLHDPRIEQRVLFREVKRMREKKDLAPWQKSILGL